MTDICYLIRQPNLANLIISNKILSVVRGHFMVFTCLNPMKKNSHIRKNNAHNKLN